LLTSRLVLKLSASTVLMEELFLLLRKAESVIGKLSNYETVKSAFESK
jgi:hypothetical protein